MEKTKPKKSVRRGLVTKSILVLLSLIILIFVTSYAWFVPPDRPVSATGLSVKTSTSSVFDIAVGFSTHKQTEDQYLVTDFLEEQTLTNMTVAGESGYTILADFTPLDLTGDGYTLVRPGLKDNNLNVDRDNPSFSMPTPNKEYLTFDLIFKCSAPSTIKLGKGSFTITPCEYASGASEPNASKLLRAQSSASPEDFNASTYGNGSFSKDAIVGALRVSAVPYDFSSAGEDDFADEVMGDKRTYFADEENFVWLPRPDMQLEPGNPIANYTLSVFSPNQGSSESLMHRYYSYDTTQTPITVTGPVNYDGTLIVGKPTSEYTLCQASYPHTVNNETTYYGKVKINIWIEGSDTEARRALAGGRFSISFDLLS